MGWPVVPEAFDQLRPRPSLFVEQPGRLEELELRLLRQESRRYMRAELSEAETVVLDTGFLGPLTYAAGLKHLGGYPDVLPRLIRETRSMLVSGRWGFADLTVYLDVSPRLQRLRAQRAKESHPESYAERHRRVGRWERRFWTTQVAPRLGRRFLRLDGRRSLPSLANAVARFRRARDRQAPTEPGEVDSLLQLLAPGDTPRRR